MYSNKLVACLKVAGKILREDKDFVTLPFGSEYSILVKNLNSVRVKVKIDIDGEDATGWIIIGPNQSTEIERFVKGNLDTGNRFKFIERTAAIENHRGIKSDDGLIRVEYAFEKTPVVQETHTHHYNHYYDSWPHGWPYWGKRWRQQNTFNQSTLTQSRGFNSVLGYSSTSQYQGYAGNFQNLNTNISKCESPEVERCSATSNDTGITVPGSVSDQKFVYVSGFDTQKSEVLILRLRGIVEEKKVETPVTVENKKVCSSCGKKSKFENKFCSACGTALNVI